MINKTNNMETLYDWLFHYNHLTKSWAAFKRENMVDYFNGNFNNVIRSSSQKTLEKLIITHGGDIKKINKAAKS